MMDIAFEQVGYAYESFRRSKKKFSPSPQQVSEGDAFALRDISFAMSSTECLAILGRSGSGKSTLMNLFTGLIRPTSGRVTIDAQDIFSGAVQLSSVRQRIGLVFQFPESQLFELTVDDDVAYGPRNLGLAEAVVQKRVEESLEAVGLPVRDFAKVDPMRLSQGEKRRAAIAGILAMQPEMLIVDEPTAGLDASGREMLIAMLHDFRRRDIGLVLISHDTSLAAGFARRALILDAGCLAYDGDRAMILSDQRLALQWGLEMSRALRLADALFQRNFSKEQVQQLLQDDALFPAAIAG